jgi:hypothetical protein
LRHPGPLWIRNLFIRSKVKVVSSNPVHGEAYSIQHYVINFSQWLVTGRWFSPGTPVSSTNKTDSHDITEILLKVALNTINQPYCLWIRNLYFKLVLVVYEWKKNQKFLLFVERRITITRHYAIVFVPINTNKTQNSWNELWSNRWFEWVLIT